MAMGAGTPSDQLAMPAISITALTEPVSIVHVPVAAVDSFVTKLFWTIDRASTFSSEFFNLTSNRIEIALFAATDLINAEWGSVHNLNVRVNGPWRVFEISSPDSNDNDDEGSNYDSPHLRYVSAPLAEAGVTILYQSSYHTDFLLVKEGDFESASRLFAARGWHVDPNQRSVRRRSALTSGGSTTLAEQQQVVPPPPAAHVVLEPPPAVAEITVLSSPLACVGLTKDIEAQSIDRVKKYLVWPERALVTNLDRSEGAERAMASPPPAMVSRRRSSVERKPTRPFISYTRTDDHGSSVLTELRVIRAMFTPEELEQLLEAAELDREDNSEDEFIDCESDEESEPLSPLFMTTSPSASSSHRHSLPGTNHSLPGTPTVGCSSAATMPVPLHWASTSTTPASTPTSRHFERFSIAGQGAMGMGMGMGIVGGGGSFSMNPYATHSRTNSETLIRLLRSSSSSGGGGGGGGSKSTARTRRMSDSGALLMEAFNPLSPHQRAESTSSGAGTAGGDTDRSSDRAQSGGNSTPLAAVDENEPQRTMRCLQLDLRGLTGEGSHIDTTGLVTRFSERLNSGNIKMLYSSTTHTANILVDIADVSRAEVLLRNAADPSDEFARDDEHRESVSEGEGEGEAEF